jgi:hypothetical protein
MQTKLNQRAPYGTITGKCREYPEARYEQNGMMFDSAGNLAYLPVDGGLEKYDPEKHTHVAESVAAPADEAIDAGKAAAQALSEHEQLIADLEHEVQQLERKLEQAKSGDINDPDYTQRCADLQSMLTKTKRALTKATNKAAVVETQSKMPEKNLAAEEADV